MFNRNNLLTPVLKLLGFALLVVCIAVTPVYAKAKHHRPIAPSEGNPFYYTKGGFQNLVYGGSTTVDVINAVGRSPDDIVKAEQMYPVVENYIYKDENDTGSATVFVFEANLLVGLHYRSANNQYIDLTYVLANNGDRSNNYMMNGGYGGYYLNPQYYGVGAF